MIFTRRIGEIVKIGDEITVTVLDITGRQVRVGIQAPQLIPVHRKEVYDKIKGRLRRQTGGTKSAA